MESGRLLQAQEAEGKKAWIEEWEGKTRFGKCREQGGQRKRDNRGIGQKNYLQTRKTGWKPEVWTGLEIDK